MAGHQFVGTGRLSCGWPVGSTTACPPMSASAHGVLFNGSSGGALAADMWPALYFPVDSLEISPRRRLRAVNSKFLSLAAAPSSSQRQIQNRTRIIKLAIRPSKAAFGFAASRPAPASGAGACRTREREIESSPSPQRSADSRRHIPRLPDRPSPPG